jgi:3-dehydroquinate dehydratase / shikimate dehydrogenase
MLFSSLSNPTIPKDLPTAVEGLELRLDLCPKIDLEEVKTFLGASPRPVMLTLRKASQGGKFHGTEEKREGLIEHLLALSPPFFDLEGDMRPAFLQKAIASHPKTRFVLSHHDFEKTPENLREIHTALSRYSPFCCKIAALALSTNDALRMLLLAKKHPKTSAICMGEMGEFARVLGKVVGNPIDYAYLQGHSNTAPGQISVQDLVDIYRYPTLNAQTDIYGLIGNPVAKSPGHIYHNAVFQKRNVNALYIKMIVNPEELETFIGLAKELGIRGLSVTIPLKEKILPFVDEMDAKTRSIGAVNTLLFKEDRIYGTNTDGAGAIDAIEKHLKVKGKKVVLIGAGGAARGIAFEAKARGAHVLILNRTLSRAEELAAAAGGSFGGLGDLPRDADILINCSPDPMPIDIPSSSLVMDIVIAPKETPFLKAALRLGCRVVFGEEMFLNQAAAQTKFWMG